MACPKIRMLGWDGGCGSGIKWFMHLVFLGRGDHPRLVGAHLRFFEPGLGTCSPADLASGCNGIIDKYQNAEGMVGSTFSSLFNRLTYYPTHLPPSHRCISLLFFFFFFLTTITLTLTTIHLSPIHNVSHRSRSRYLYSYRITSHHTIR